MWERWWKVPTYIKIILKGVKPSVSARNIWEVSYKTVIYTHTAHWKLLCYCFLCDGPLCWQQSQERMPLSHEEKQKISNISISPICTLPVDVHLKFGGRYSNINANRKTLLFYTLKRSNWDSFAHYSIWLTRQSWKTFLFIKHFKSLLINLANYSNSY